MFSGREKELSAIRELLKRDSASAIVYGKRKVGKTTLIREALKYSSDKTVYFECIKSTMQENVDGFVAELYRVGALPVELKFSSFQDVFRFLNTQKSVYNVIIDEYPYLKEMNDAKTVDSIFQTIVDNHIGNIRLFISGSHVAVMRDMLSEGNALYGRFDLIIKLCELDYIDAAAFYPQKSVYDKIAFYSVFGGSPYINEFIDEKKGLRENIENTVLNFLSPVFNYAERLLLSDYSNAIGAERIFYAIANGKKRYADIEAKLDMKSTGLLSKQLNYLLDMQIIDKYFPINKKTDKKKIFYELKDNLIRFYYAYVYKNKSALTVLGAHAFYERYVEPSITEFISRRFESLCRDFISIGVQSGAFKGVTDIGTYYFDDPTEKTNGEFDVATERDGGYDIFEVKYHKDRLTEKEMLDEEKQIRSIKGVNINNIGFISASGFADTPGRFELFDGEEIYKIKNV